MKKDYMTETLTISKNIENCKYNLIVTLYTFIVCDLNYDFVSNKSSELKDLLSSFELPDNTSFPTRFSNNKNDTKSS